MADYTITAHGSATYEGILDTLIEYARESDSQFDFGPFDRDTLAASGLTLVTDDDKLVTKLQALTEVSVMRR